MQELQNPRKGYKQTEIGEIPNEWNIRKLEELADLNAGGTPSRFTNNYWENGTIHWLSSGEVRNNVINSSNEKITQLGLSESAAKLFPKGTVLIAITGQGLTRGRTALLGIDSTTNQSVVGILCNKSIINNLFLWYYLQNQYWKLRSISQGSNQAGLNLEILNSYRVLVPPLLEQQKITSILSKVDDLIQKTDQVIEQTQTLKKGLMNRLFTKGIGYNKFKTVQFHPRIVQHEIPIDWKFEALERVLLEKPQNGITIQAASYGTGYPIAEIDSLYSSDFFLLQDNLRRVPLNPRELSKYHLSDNDFLINRVSKVKSGAGKMVLVKQPIKDLVYEGNLIRFRINDSLLIPEFFEYFSKCSLYLRYMQSVCKTLTLTSIDQHIIHGIPVIIPPKEQQKKILDILSNLDLKITNFYNNRVRLKKLKKGFMLQLLTGKIRVKV